MAGAGPKPKRKSWGVTGLSLLLGTLIFLSGCSSFESNPVVQSLQKGDPYIDLTRDHLDSLFDEYGTGSPSPAEEDLVTNRDRALIDSFVTRVQQADGLEYQRLISYSGEQPTPADPVDDFLLAPLLLITEEKDKVMVTDGDEKRRIFKEGLAWYFFQLNLPSTKEDEEAESEASVEELIAATEAEIPPNPRLTAILLGELCRSPQLTLLSVEPQLVGETTYMAYNIKENDNLAKWFFDDQGNLFLRIFQDGDMPVAVRYDFLNFRPTIQPIFFTLEGAQTLPSVAPKEEEKETEEKKDEEGLKDPVEKAEIEREEIPPKEEEKAEVKAEEKVAPPATTPPATTPPATTPPTTTPPATTPPTTTPPATTPPATAPPKKETKPHVVPDFSGGKAPLPPKVEPKEDPDMTIKLPTNYPSDQFPLIGGFQLESASDMVDALQRDIHIVGEVMAPLDSISRYYEQLFALAYPSDSKEIYDEENNETYILFNGRKDGWAYTVEITESHFTSRCTLSIRLRR